MAVKKNLEVVPLLPTQTETTEQDLESLLSARLADELIDELDISKLAKLTVSKMGIKIKQRFINWLLADNSAPVPMNEIEAASEEVAA
jgi:hypothetical protein